MEDIKTTPQAPATEVPTPKKRSALVVAVSTILLFLLLGLFGGLAYWGYQSYVKVGEDSTVSESIVPASTQTSEEKDLDKAEKDLKADDSLSTDDAQKEADDINSVDISGI